MRTSTLAVLLILFAAVRIASTYRIYSQIVDEATHVGAGLELLQSHRYVLQDLNPPLPRLIWATLARTYGMRIDQSNPDFLQQLRSVYDGHENYRNRLVVVRSGTLFFFILACWAVFLAARDALGDRAALVALFLFTTEPIVLGYSGLATHDAPAIAGVALALLAFTRWLRRPDLPHGIAVGAAYAFSALCKFSCIGFVPAACAAIWIVRMLHDRHPRWLADIARLIAIVAITTPLLVWAGYGFTVGPVDSISPFMPLPAPALIEGIRGLIHVDREGVRSYLCGEVSTAGWWWYFPFAIGLKTTLTFFILLAIAAWFGLCALDLRWTLIEWTAAAIAMLAICLPSSIDLGVRYVLPVYGPLAIAAAAGLSAARPRAVVGALLAAHLCVSLLAHPDYFPYFNLLGGNDPSAYLIDSNLDWGQDVLRLQDALSREHVDYVTLSCLTIIDYDAHRFPPHGDANPWQAARGWVAVSDYSYRMTRVENGWKWLEGQPYRRIGKSIRLYHLP